jgi:hypothetical protein
MDSSNNGNASNRFDGLLPSNLHETHVSHTIETPPDPLQVPDADLVTVLGQQSIAWILFLTLGAIPIQRYTPALYKRL